MTHAIRAEEVGEPFALYVSRAQKLDAKSVADFAKNAQATPPKHDKETDADRFRVAWPNLAVDVSVFRKVTDSEHLDGFAGYLQKQAGKMDGHTFHLIRRIQRTSRMIGLIPDRPWTDEGLTFVKALAKEHKAIVFGNGASACDPDLRVLLGPRNRREQQAKMPEFSSALERRKRSFDELAKRRIPTLSAHPPIVSEEEARLRTAKEIAERAAVLYAVARAAEDEDFAFDRFLERNGLSQAVSPAEREFLDAKPRDPKRASALTWRYEACHALLWTLGQAPEYRFPDRQCQARAIWELMEDGGAQKLIAEAKLRPTMEILDQVDLVYRLAWASRSTKIKDEIVAGLNGDVTMERHVAFCWLVRHFNRDWDDVSPDT